VLSLVDQVRTKKHSVSRSAQLASLCSYCLRSRELASVTRFGSYRVQGSLGRARHVTSPVRIGGGDQDQGVMVLGVTGRTTFRSFGRTFFLEIYC